MVVTTLRARDEVFACSVNDLDAIVSGYVNQILAAGHVNDAFFAVRVPLDCVFFQRFQGNQTAASDGQPNRDDCFGQNGK